MPEETTKQTVTALPTAVARALWLGAILGVVAYTALVLTGDPEKWGQRGDAMGPLAVILNAAALIAIYQSVVLQQSGLDIQQRELKLQRRELELQRKEFEQNRAVLEDQRAEFKRTAEAQEALAKSQARLAEAQLAANDLAITANISQCAGFMVSLEIAEAEIAAKAAHLSVTHSSNQSQAFLQALAQVSRQLGDLKKQELEEIERLNQLHSKKGTSHA